MLRVLLVVALVTSPSCVNAKRINRKFNAAQKGTQDVLNIQEKKEVMLGKSEEPSQYKYVQQVGLSLYTFPEGFAKAGVQAFYNGIDDSVLQRNRSGNTVVNIEIMEDVNQRVNIMKDMMEVAYQSEYYERDERVLKVFMAPEFFFRGPHGAYDMRNLAGCPKRYLNRNMVGIEECDRPVITILELLSKAVQDDKWKDWVFVFGTIVSFIEDATLNGKIHYFNFAPVVRGGTGDTKHHIVAKTFVSGIDFLDCPSGIGKRGRFCVDNPRNLGTGTYAPFVQDQKQELARYGFTIQTKNKFVVAGITFGLEVCLDHAEKELAANPEGVQVHLIVSAGMEIMWTVPKLPGAAYHGPVFLQDGGSGGATTQYYCPSCPFLDTKRFWAPGSNPSGVVQSPREGEEWKYHKYNATKFPRFYPPGEHFTTPPSIPQWYSPKGFGTEGSGLGTDPRFANTRINHIFASDDYKPKINVGPAFQVPVNKYDAPRVTKHNIFRQPPTGPSRFTNKPAVKPPARPNRLPPAPTLLKPKPVVTKTEDYSCYCRKEWVSTSHGACDNGCCFESASEPFGWCFTHSTCKGKNWKTCAVRFETTIGDPRSP